VPERSATSTRRAAAESGRSVNRRSGDPVYAIVTFAYVPGGSTLGAFAAFLRDDGALFRRLGQSPIRFCTTSADVARKARGLCHRLYQPTGLAMHPAVIPPGDPVVRRDAVLHFEARRRFEARAFHTFSQGDLDRLREER
jgi:hypothetical protein